MKKEIFKSGWLFFFMSFTLSAFGQTGGEGFSYFTAILFALAILIVFVVIIQVANNLLRMEAKKVGADKGGANYSVFPKLNELSRSRLPAYAANENVTVLKKGHDILLEGEAETRINEEVKAKTFSVQPPNFVGISPIPKVTVEEGAEVKAGDVLFFDKKRPDVKYVAPVSGEVIAIKRAEKRSICDVVILADKSIKYREYPSFDLENGSREELVNYLLDSGVWPMFRQRPYDVVAEPGETPKNIFISTFGSAPLAPDYNFVVEGKKAQFQKGLDVLGKLTSGSVFLGLNARGENPPSTVFTQAEGVEKRWFHGPHPSGNIGVQIHHIHPITPQDKVWVLGVQEVITLGTLFTEGKYDAERIVAVTGAELKEPLYVRTYLGANIGDLIEGNLKNDHVRMISGDVLSGKKKTGEQFLNFYDDQITVVEEGDQHELFGWLLPVSPRPSISNTFPNFLFPDLKFRANTNTHGEKRAFVVTGQYEKVLPMDIYPQHLFKSIIVNDFERMEGLGIYELSEEDVALCEFVCTSKMPLQSILREGLDTMREQG